MATVIDGSKGTTCRPEGTSEAEGRGREGESFVSVDSGWSFRPCG